MARRIARYLMPACAGLVVLIGCLMVRAEDPGALQAFRERAFDFYQRIDPRPIGPEVPVRIVDIDDASLAALGQWPWPRNRLAKLLETLSAAGAAVVAFDMIFPEPDRSSPQQALDSMDLPPETRARMRRMLADAPSHDAQFASMLSRTTSVLGVANAREPSSFAPIVEPSVAGPSPLRALDRVTGVVNNLPILQDAASGVGGINVSKLDDDAVIRRIPVLKTVGETMLPSLFAETLRLVSNDKTIILRTNPDPLDPEIGIPERVRLGSFEAPVTATGAYRLLYGTLDPALTISAQDVLQAAQDPASLSARVGGTIVLVGTSAPGLFDLRASPLGTIEPGVTMHAQALASIISGLNLTRPDWTEGLERVIIAGLGLASIALALLAPPLWGALASAALLIATLAGSWWAFSERLFLVDASAPIIATIATFGAVTIPRLLITENQQRFIRNAFALYLAEPVLQRLERDPDMLSLDGERRTITVLFMDVRGFTSRSETMEPTDAVDLLNALLDPLSNAVLAEEGTIDKFMGDGMMAFWNAPLDQPDHAARALRAAKRMVAVVDEVNGRLAITPPLAIGVGVHTGDAFVGNMGSKRRFAYSAIGDTVNLAARVEALTGTTGTPLLITAETYEAAKQQATDTVSGLAKGGGHMVKGRTQEVQVYRLADDQISQSSQ